MRHNVSTTVNTMLVEYVAGGMLTDMPETCNWTWTFDRSPLPLKNSASTAPAVWKLVPPEIAPVPLPPSVLFTDTDRSLCQLVSDLRTSTRQLSLSSSVLLIVMAT